MKPRATIAASCLVLALFCSPAFAAPKCTLVAVDKAQGAKLRVYFTKFLKEDNTEGKYKTCRVVTKADASSITFFVTPFRQDATDVVHESNWPR